MNASSFAGTVYTFLLTGLLPQRRARRRVRSALLAAALALSPLVAAAAEPAPAVGGAPEAVVALMTKDLVGAHGKEIVMITVTYVPGGASLPHRHDAQVFVYLLEGEMTMQVRGHPPVTLHPGETFYEGPADIHQVSANASLTAPAKILVFLVKDKAKPGSRGVKN